MILTFDSKAERDFYYENDRMEKYEYHKAEETSRGLALEDCDHCGDHCPAKELASKTQSVVYQHVIFQIPLSERILNH